jgi:hypothetical protein
MCELDIGKFRTEKLLLKTLDTTIENIAKDLGSGTQPTVLFTTVVDDAIRFVSSNKSKEKQKSCLDNSNQDDKESDEPDYDEDEDQLEEKQEKETSLYGHWIMDKFYPCRSNKSISIHS